ncbi:hypothetical protein B0J17DRAFT_771714 [Rhizoctonia solani]|nr:hypothetical protein B0J17DRAFT_771714 [Rhizoctonia solani]
MSDRATNIELVNSKLASPTVPLNRRSNERALDKSVTYSQLSDSKYLEEPGGGCVCESGLVETIQNHSGEVMHGFKGDDHTTPPYKSRVPPGRVERLIIKTPVVAKEALKTLVNRKDKKKSSSLPGKRGFNASNERHQSLPQKPEQIKNNFTIRTRLSQEFFGKQPRRKKAKTSTPANTCPPAPADSNGKSSEPVYDKVFLGVLQRTNSNTLETWWRTLGFEKVRQGPVKVSKYIKALEAVGFKRRNGDGAQVTFNAPTEFEGSEQGLRLPSLTLHIPHGTNIEVVELKDKADSIKGKYPIMVNTMHKMWKDVWSC